MYLSAADSLFQNLVTLVGSEAWSQIFYYSYLLWRPVRSQNVKGFCHTLVICVNITTPVVVFPLLITERCVII